MDRSITEKTLQAILDISKEINSVRNVHSLLERILDIALKNLNAERGFILLRDEKSSELLMAASRNIDPERSSDLSEISRSTVTKVKERQKPLLAFDTQEDVQFMAAESVILQKIASIACVPLLLKGKLIGVIYIDSREKTAGFNQQSLDFFFFFFNQAAIAIENVKLAEALYRENELLKGELHRVYAFKELVGNSPQMKHVFEMIGRVLNNDVTVLLTGETGTGKELAARAIHQNSRRKDKPFVAINCAVIPENLVESELFGHVKGAFTGAISDKEGLVEKAEGGTLLLDEIGEINVNLQVKLLRFLQDHTFIPVGGTSEKKVNLRILAATHKNLEEQVAKKIFREDLFYRLNVLNIQLPPLRDHRKDIPLLVDHILKKIARQSSEKRKKISAEAMEKLVAYSWPGNVRELENVLERAVVMSNDDQINPQDIILMKQDSRSYIEPGMKITQVSLMLLEQTLKACNGNKTKAAELMGVSLRWIHYQLKNKAVR
ncbi:MAG: sigma-54-dependent Fis family transcriptional regulator [Calditrichaeota bacterium]|nr:sigma-54-dependent Fis family transcriptional regulator [Calditrichota bacterium]